MVPCTGLSQFLNFSSIFHKAKFHSKSEAKKEPTPFLLGVLSGLFPIPWSVPLKLKQHWKIPYKYQLPCHLGHGYY